MDEYRSEFLSTLLKQATDRKGRYNPKHHQALKAGDVVMLVEKHYKQYCYDLGRVKSVEINSLGEATAAYVFKGKTRETVYRHATSLILLLPTEDISPCEVEKTHAEPLVSSGKLDTIVSSEPRPLRKAAAACRERLAATDY